MILRDTWRDPVIRITGPIWLVLAMECRPTRRAAGGINGPSGNRYSRRILSKAAMVKITGLEDGFSYADAIKKVRENIPLSDLGIASSH